ncbi:MAG: type II toxin-antitoxin system RelE/ParE family toxin [Mediterranea sp.]|jgi:proteic killer suppression protein|nr:type II toxin-antitoxin system RelE/ParE family toxin [Mediterranea sp.]
MEITFEQKYLWELYVTGKTSDKKHRFQPHIIAKYQQVVTILEAVSSPTDLLRYRGLRYEILKGDKNGLESVRVNDQYRIEFTTQQIASETILTVCNIIELSNHYK